ncbi:MAG: phosphoribosylamine--glycine ligase [Methyloprofundus sp.]|nr:phosphoribosylamine--glycine ligase [Methyloprofundus sp.]
MARRQAAEGFKSNKKAKKQAKIKARAENTRDERETFILACEGTKTEPLYFETIFLDLKRNHKIAASSLVIAKHRHTNPSGVLQDLLDHPNYQDFNHRWIVIDRDEGRTNGGGHNLNDFNCAINRANSKNIEVAYSNPCFEIWYLLHTEFRNTAINRDELIAKLERDYGYHKNQLFQHGSERDAIHNAKQLLNTYDVVDPANNNPSTTVHQLIAVLDSFKSTTKNTLMKIVIVGSGGREHALAWQASQSLDVENVFVAPGNAGTALEKNLTNVALEVGDTAGLLKFAQRENIGLTIIGPEVPLVAGIVDAFQAAGLNCFGPSAAAAQLEGSKKFCKDFMARHNIPTAEYDTFTDEAAAIAYIKQKGAPIVVKADGLAAGKGVIVAFTEAEAIAAVEDMLSGNSFGEAGSRVVIEEFLDGEEASFIVIADGKQALPMASSQDHKARDNGDKGPNTGGMGAYSPAPIVTAEIHQRVMDEIINPTLQGMIADGMPYTGFLYAGLMIKPNGELKVLEYNCRFGDPETQPIMMRLKSDLVTLCLAALAQDLDKTSTEWDSRSALGVVLAAGGYPNAYPKGDIIHGLPTEENAESKVFHAGTQEKDGNTVTAGGRVLCACALGDDLQQAQDKAYELTDKITWDKVYYRTDIGFKALR